ncbi:DNA-directed RNA polymerase subunit K [Candidatus Pacearchaeota archaeon]|nr:DNA-directed RNA polymerase subunit K [Candidatus Pacearchaeota archaeon]
MKSSEFTKYEKARILGARTFQIAMNAPLLIKISDADLKKIKYDSLKIAETELNSDILPISIKKPLPQKKKEILKRPKEQKIPEKEEEMVKEGEIMELATPEDEKENSDEGSEVE